MEGDYGGVTMEGKLWRRLTMEGQLSRGLTMDGDYEGAYYGGATMEEGNHLLFFGDFLAIVGHLRKVLR